MKKLVLTLALFAVTAIAADRPGIHYSTDRNEVNAKLDCGEKEFNWFSLKKNAAVPAEGLVVIGGRDYGLIEPGDTRVVRLDVCLDTEKNEAELRRVVTLDGESRVLIASFPMAGAVVQGVSPALLEGKLEGLKIEFLLDEEYGLRIEGRSSLRGAYVIATPTYNENGRQMPSRANLTAGVFEFGNAFEGGRCAIGERLNRSTFRFGTADFVAEVCERQGVGETTDYDFISLSVTDRNPALTEAQRATFAFQGPDKLKDVLIYRHNHHNACDSFRLRLPHAVYAASSAPVAGCGRPVEDAPPRTMRNSDRSVHYRTRYGTAPWVEGRMTECGHYLFGCDVLSGKSKPPAFPEAASLESLSAAAQAPSHLTELRSVADWRSLSAVEEGKRRVKFTLLFDGYRLFFQNTDRYPFHLPFLKAELPQFEELSSQRYEELLFGGRGTKALSAGALYYSDSLKVPEYPEKGLAAYTVYYKGEPNISEIAVAYAKLQKAVPFIDGRLAFGFERRADYFKYKVKLCPMPSACIPSLPLDRFKDRP